MTYGCQKLAKALGESGCYFLSLLKVAESHDLMLDPILEAAEAITAGTMGADCFVQDASRLFSEIVRERFIVIKAGPGHELPLEYLPKPGEREILRFERDDPASGAPLSHFVVGDGRGRVLWDPWPDSQTVSRGRLASKRIIRRMP